MFEQNAYESIQLGFPPNGMNQNISPEILSKNFAYYLENIISSSLGKGRVRFGTTEITDLPYDNTLYKIIEAFPYQKTNGDKQIVCYLQYFSQYQNANNVVCLANNRFAFVGQQGDIFEEDTPIRIQYRTQSGTVTTQTFITGVSANAFNGTTFTLKSGVLPTQLPADLFIEIEKNSITRVDNHTVSFTPKPNGALNNSFDPALNPNVRIRLLVDGNETLHAIQSYDATQPNSFVIQTALNDVPNFDDQVNNVRIFYESFVCEILSFSITKGSIVIYDFLTDALLNETRENMASGVVPRSVTFQGKLLICNGVDPVLSWDGNDISEVVDFVKEQANSFNRTDDTHFTFTASAAFIIGKYQNPHGEAAKIKLKVNNVISDLTVSAININQNTVTITTVENLPAFNAQSRVELFYRDWPPAFSFMYVAYNFIFALGKGAVGLKYRDPDEALRFYRTYRPNSVTDWFNENTKTVPSINIADTHGIPDNLEAICFVNGRLALMGRYKTQVWIITDRAAPVFEFNTILPVGTVHGNLVIELPNDTYFVSQNGLMSFGTLNIAQQFAASSADAIDPLIRDQVIDITKSNILYRSCRSFKYPTGTFCGFKIGDNNPVIGTYNTNIYAWSSFSGDFARSSTFLSTLDGALYLFIEDRILQYADGVSIPESYGDNNGNDIIYYSWILPVIQSTKARWANKRYELQVDYSSSFVIDNRNKIFIRIRGDISKTFSLKNMYNLNYKGDVIGEIPFSSSNDRNSIGYRMDEPFNYPKGRLKFTSSQFWLSLEGQVINSPLEFNTIKLFGISERGRN